MFGQHWNFFEIIATVASWFAGLVLFLIWLAIVVLFVRFLLIGTRAAKVYLRSNGVHDGVLPRGIAMPATGDGASSAPATTASPKPRTPRPPKA
jgi:hypothetical protein